jgi:N-acetylmuramoyl-L-alanine amidase
MRILLFILLLVSCKQTDKPIFVDPSEVQFAFNHEEPESDSLILSQFIMQSGVEQIYLIIHTSAESDKGQFKDGEHINKFFRADPPNGRGWKNPGYAEWLSRDCKWYQLKHFNIDCMIEPWEITNGARGYNTISVHIAYSSAIPLDNPTADTRTECQKDMLLDRIKLYKSICPNVIVMGHRDLPGVTKSCPNYDVMKEYKNI